jgi:hypothetical protein
MSLAKYFKKDLLAISQVLKKVSKSELENSLNSNVIEIAFDNSIRSGEAQLSADLAVSLVSRLYPKIIVTDITQENSKILSELISKAKNINSNIEIVQETPTASLIIGSTSLQNRSFPVYIGSYYWTSKLSILGPVNSAESELPFAAGISVCYGLSNIFKYTFKSILTKFDLDSEFALSLLTLSQTKDDDKLTTKDIDLGSVLLVGLGAIGNGFLWSLSNMTHVKGNLTLIDPQRIELSNLQRYCMTTEQHLNLSKVRIIEGFSKNDISLESFEGDWSKYLNNTNNWKNQLICVAVDSAKDRIAIQSSLPEYILNAYTENNLVGISRHFDFYNKACLACGLMPEQKTKNRSMEVSENLNIPQQERLIRDYLYQDKLVDKQLLQLVADANSIDLSELLQFEDMSMESFYSQAVCGGHLQFINNSSQSIEIEAPLSFQSTLAGILLASEMILYRLGARSLKFYNQTHIHPLSPISEYNPYNHTLGKNKTGKCICNDEVFRKNYLNKWTK